MNNKSFSTKRIGLILIFVVIISKVLSFFKQILVANYFGANSLTDIYFLADSSVALFSSAISVGLGTAVLTYYVKFKSKNEDCLIYTSNLIIFAALFSFIICCVVCLFSDELSSFLAGITYSSYEITKLSSFIKILSITICTMTISATLSSILEGNKIYLPTKLQSLIVCIISIFFVYIGGFNENIDWLVYGYLISYCIYLLFILYCSNNQNILRFYRPKLDKNTLSTFTMSFPVMLSIAIVDINHMVDKIISVRLGAGIVTSLYYSQLASVDMIASVLIFALNGIIVNKFSSYAATKQQTLLMIEINKMLLWMTSITIIVCDIYLLFSDYLSSIVFGHMKSGISLDSIYSISKMMMIYSIGIVLIPFREIFLRVFYSFQNSKTPFYSSLVSVAINIVLSVYFSSLIGYVGIPLATNISILVNIFILYFCSKRYIPDYKFCFVEFVKVCFVGLVVLCIGIILNILFESMLISPIVILLLVIIYILGLYISKSTVVFFKSE